MKVNDWELRYLPILKKRIDKLEKRVINLRDRNPKTYLEHKDTLFLAKIYRVICKLVPNNPDNQSFRIGDDLGSKYSIFRRVKSPLPSRYRLFYAFSSQLKKIVYAWLNDNKYIRRSGDFNDVYQAFIRKLASKNIPFEFSELIEESKKLDPNIKEILPKKN
ncbi:MAG: type II toxin-antitoxin system YhaV family toxin [SAR324 cluster bacterium]|nr:type II toxin-antitoxin system YhaV family toxin [SAR324 cluster bacterium]